MHIVTKFLVVFAAILGVVLSALSIAYTSNADRLTNAIRDERNKAQTAQAEAADFASAAARARQELDDRTLALSASIDEMTSQVERLDRENARYVARIKELEQNELRYETSISDFTAIIDAFAKLDDARTNELSGLRDKELKAARREIELADRINDLAGQLEVAIETNRSLQEQLAEARQQVELAERGSLGAGDDYVRSAPRNFRARVIDVIKEQDGSTLIGIDAGSSDGLEENMKLMVIRPGAGFIANLQVTKVDLNESVARVTLRQASADGRSVMEILDGDIIQSSPL